MRESCFVYILSTTRPRSHYTGHETGARALVRPTIREGVDACRATHPPSAVRAILFCFAVCQSRRLMNAVVVIVRELWLSSCQQHTSRRGTCGSRPPCSLATPSARRSSSDITENTPRHTCAHVLAKSQRNRARNRLKTRLPQELVQRWRPQHRAVVPRREPPAHLPGRGGMRWVPAPSACAVSDRAALAPSQRGDDGVPCCDWVDDVWVHAGAHLTVPPHDEVLP